MGRRRACCTEEGLNRGAWTAPEDQILTDYINIHGEGKWRTIPKEAGLKRCGKSCRLRWLNYLKPDIKRGNISPDEEDLIIRLHKLLGNRWSLIAGRLPGRTDNEIKNYWNTKLKKKLRGDQPKSTQSKNEKKKKKTPALRESDKLKGEDVVEVVGLKCNNNDNEDGREEYPMEMECSFGELLLSDIPDSDFWKVCQSNDHKSSGGRIGLEQPVLLFSEDMLKDWIRDDTFTFGN